MKSKIVPLLVALTFTCSAYCEIVNLSKLTQDQVESFFEEGGNSNVILECSKGSSLPVKLSVGGDFLFGDGSIDLKVKKTCYIKNVKDTYLFSLDSYEWKSFEDFFTGNLQVVVDANEGFPQVSLGIDLRQK